jgi:Fic-DOC domain mobile mystery protein B
VGLNRKLTAADLSAAAGQTPLNEDDLDGIIPDHIDSREQLNQWEAENIKVARRELATRRKPLDVLSTDGLIELHKMMFGATWRWAGEYAKTMNQFSDPRTPRSVQMREVVENTKEMLRTAGGNATQLDDIAARFHHQLTRIHPWRNGNGRHAREAADALLRSVGRPPFTWGNSADLVGDDDVRDRYIAALRAADAGDYRLLREFVRS